MIRVNYGCDKRVRYCALIFAADIVPSLSTIQWDLKKPACESTEGLARPLKKKISCQTQKWNFWKRPSTDFDKNYVFGIGTSSAIEWYLSFLLSISWPSDEPWSGNTARSRLRAPFGLARGSARCSNLEPGPISIGMLLISTRYQFGSEIGWPAIGI